LSSRVAAASKSGGALNLDSPSILGVVAEAGGAAPHRVVQVRPLPTTTSGAERHEPLPVSAGLPGGDGGRVGPRYARHVLCGDPT
jgi:hypothetical protein